MQGVLKASLILIAHGAISYNKKSLFSSNLQSFTDPFHLCFSMILFHSIISISRLYGFLFGKLKKTRLTIDSDIEQAMPQQIGLQKATMLLGARNSGKGKMCWLQIISLSAPYQFHQVALEIQAHKLFFTSVQQSTVFFYPGRGK